jgi:deoxycytidine triphosphate deaminase
MFINPKTAIQEGWIKGDITTANIQPNAIDFTVDRMFQLNVASDFILCEQYKDMRNSFEIFPSAEVITSTEPPQSNMFWNLQMGVYDALSNFYVEVPEGVAAYLIVRSTLNRNGLFVTSGLYDSGFIGHIGFAIHNNGGPAYIAPGTRVGQIIFVESQNVGTYAGGYNHIQGTTAHQTEV